MIKLSSSIQAWGTAEFSEVLKKEICALDPGLLPLQQGLKHSSMANGENFSTIILKTVDDIDNIFVTAGLLYTGIVAGCNCADDPTPVDENNEYCEVLFCINKVTAVTTVSLID